MPHTSALPAAGVRPSADARRAAPATATGPVAAGRRPYSNATIARLSDLQYELDELIRDVNHGPASHRQHDSNVEAAERIAAGLRAVFRSPTIAKLEHPPLWQDGNGKAGW